MLTVRGAWVCCLAVVLASMTAGGARGAVLDLIAVKDASIFSEAGDVANGSGYHIHCGRTMAGNVRRALLQFDLSSIPAGSTVTGVTLTIYVDEGANNGPTETIQLRRITQSWSEGPSGIGSTGGGAGFAAEVGDVTWTHRVYSTQTWTTAGGTFSGTASGSASVSSAAGPKTFSTAGMVTDVQNWLNSPATNFGWMLVGDEGTNRSARRIISRQNLTASSRPRLTVTYTPPAGTGACCANDGSCTIQTNAACVGASGVYKGDGTVCSPNPCPQPSGACCTAGGGCAVQTPTACASSSGMYVGNGTTCAPNPCLSIAGACCATNATCSVQAYSACIAGGGSYRGYGVACAGQDCPWVLTPFVDPLPLPTVAVPLSGTPGDVATYRMEMLEIQHQFHSSLPMTKVWGYGGQYPGPTIEAYRDRPVTVTWANELRDTGQPVPPYRTQHVLTVDTCVHGPNVTGVVPYTVVHLHGAHVPPDSDGLPDLAFPPGQQSPPYVYTNNQQAGTLWYHDHALGLTRLNVYMGLAGFYLLRDDAEAALNLPRGENEIPLVIQDRSFKPDGQLDYHTTFVDQFFGNFITVNGKVWPYLNVRQGKYRFRLLNGSNSRTYTLSLKNGGASVPFQQIGTDLGLLPAPVTITSLTLMPGERADVVMDFAALNEQTAPWRLENSAASPFPNGGAGPDIQNVMEFRGTSTPGDTDPVPASLTPVPPISEAEAIRTRDFHLQKFFDNVCNHDMWLINSLMWSDITEFPVLGTTEIWRWINRSGIAHPMHVHLVQFQVLDRQSFTIGPGNTVIPTGAVIPAAANERGWKDTVQATPNQITRVIMRFLDYPGTYPYHCHILEHEDHEMMRQFTVVCPPLTFTTQPTAAVNVRRGQNVTLTAAANGAAPIGYGWRRTDPDVTYSDGPTGNGSTVSGSQTGSFTISNIQLADAGRHSCVATDACGVIVASQSAIITVFCAGDFNLSGAVSVQDIFDFLAAYFSNLPAADVNNSGTVSVQDIFDYLAMYFGPC